MDRRATTTQGTSRTRRVRAERPPSKRPARQRSPGQLTRAERRARAEAPSRTCVGCGQQACQSELLRCIHAPDGGLVVDLKSSALGRGAWVHPRPECIARALTRGFARSFRANVQTDAEQFYTLLTDAATRRVGGLIQASRARGALLFGRDVVRENLARVQVALLATDVSSLQREAFVTELGQRGKLMIWGDKQRFGQWLGRGDVAIVAITESGLANEVAKAVALLRLASVSGRAGSSAEGMSSSEDR